MSYNFCAGRGISNKRPFMESVLIKMRWETVFVKEGKRGSLIQAFWCEREKRKRTLKWIWTFKFINKTNHTSSIYCEKVLNILWSLFWGEVFETGKIIEFKNLSLRRSGQTVLITIRVHWKIWEIGAINFSAKNETK